MKELPYIEELVTTTLYKYNPKYGDDRVCKCGHPYYRHFDTYEDMKAVGCKYCSCMDFKEQKTKKINKKSLKEGQVYYDTVNKENVEYRYMGQTGRAIVCEPGDSGGGMQSSWAINPENLECPTTKNNT